MARAERANGRREALGHCPSLPLLRHECRSSTAVDEDDGAVFGHDQVGPAGERLVFRAVDGEAVAEMVEHPSPMAMVHSQCGAEVDSRLARGWKAAILMLYKEYSKAPWTTKPELPLNLTNGTQAVHPGIAHHGLRYFGLSCRRDEHGGGAGGLSGP